MPAPGSYPDFDTNGTNTTAIVSGHATDGYANNEVPTAREINQILMLIGLWIRWLASFVFGGWQWVSPFAAQYNGASTTAPNVGTFASPRKNYAFLASTSVTDQSLALYPIVVPVGNVVTDVGAYVDANSSTSPVLNVNLVKVDATGTETTIAGVVNAVPAGGVALYSHALTAPYTVQAGDALYILVVGVISSGSGMKVYQAGYKAGAV